MKPLDNLNRFLYNRTKGAIPPPQPEESNTMKIERKISFTVAGIEFQNLKTAQFFKRAVELETQGLSSDAKNKFDADRELLDTWYTMLSYSRGMVDPELVVSTVMALQLPKPARKKKETEVKSISATTPLPHPYW